MENPLTGEFISTFQEPFYHILSHMSMYGGSSPVGCEGALLGFIVSLAADSDASFHKVIASWQKERKYFHHGRSELFLCEIPGKYEVQNVSIDKQLLQIAEDTVCAGLSMQMIDLKTKIYPL